MHRVQGRETGENKFQGKVQKEVRKEEGYLKTKENGRTPKPV